jgi:hypothetical protein
MKVGKAIYNILSQSTDVQSNFPFNTANYSPTGTELVTNGDFASASGWNANANWLIDTVAKTLSSDGTSNNDVNQGTWTPELDKSYKIVYTIDSITQGSYKIKLGGVTTTPRGAAETYTEYVTTTDLSDSGGRLRIQVDNDNAIGTISNISIKEVVLTKIFPELAPPDIDAPYIVYSVVSNSPSETKNANGDIDTANIEVYGFQDTYNKAVDLGVSVRAALDRKTGTYNTIQIQSTNYVNEQMDVNEARKLWAAIQDYSIRIKNI